MDVKVKLVLLFSKIRKPIEPGSEQNIAKVRKTSARAALLGSWLYDKKVDVYATEDTRAGDVPVRIYKSKQGDNQPVMVYYHGGGFALLGIQTHDNVCRRLAVMNKCVVISVDYRLAPEHTFPAAHDDAWTALLWARENAHKWGGNAKQLIVAGDSAGGNLAACMAHRCKKNNIHLTAQILVYPWVDGRLCNPSIERNGQGYLLTREAMFWFQQQYTPRKEDQCAPEVSPIFETDFSGLAPAFVLTAQYDPLLDDGFQYYQKLHKAGNPAHYKEYKGLIHGFFNLPFLTKEAYQAHEDIRDFLTTTIYGTGS